MELLTDKGSPPPAPTAGLHVTTHSALPSAILLPPPVGFNADNATPADTLLAGLSASVPIMTLSALVSAPPSSILVDTGSPSAMVTSAPITSNSIIVLTSDGAFTNNDGGLLLDSRDPVSKTVASAQNTSLPFPTKNSTREATGTSTLLTFNGATQNTVAFCAVGAALLALI